MGKVVFGGDFDKSAMKKEILVSLHHLPEDILKANSRACAEIAVTLGNCVRALSHYLENGEAACREDIGHTPTTLATLAAQLREAGLRTWDAKNAPDSIQARLDGIQLSIEKILTQGRKQ